MAVIESKQKNFFDLKKPTQVHTLKIEKVQDILEILKVSVNGIFKVAEGWYSKTYLIDDVNYESMSYEEQVIFYADWCKILDSFNSPLKITIINQRRNMKTVREKILYQHKGNRYDEICDAYNDIIEKKIITDKKGLEQKKYLTVMTEQKTYEDAKRYFAMTEKSIKDNFKKILVKLHPLNGNERLCPIFNFFRMGEEEEYALDIADCIKRGQDWKNEIAPDYITISKNKFESSHVLGRALYIEPHSYNGSIEDKFLDELASLQTCSIVSIDYVPTPRDWMKATLENKYMGVEDKIVKQQDKRNKQKNFMSDITYNVRMEKEEIEELLEEARSRSAKMHWVGVTTVITAEDDTKLEEYTTSLQKICSNNSCSMKICNNLQREGINTALPIGVRNLPFMRAMFTRMAGGFLPFKVMEATDSENPFYYGANMVSGNPILRNRKKLPNPNGFVMGISGFGKSFTGAKMEMGSVFVNTEDDIIIIDPQNEFEEVVGLFDGTYINLDEKAETYVNPLDIKLEDLKTKKGLDDIIKEKRQLMYSIAVQRMDGEEIFGLGSVLGRCVKELYSDIADLPENERFVPLMENLYPYVEKRLAEERNLGNEIKAEVAERVSIALEGFWDGSLEIYNHHTNVNPNNRVIAYGMRDLGEELWPVSVSIMLSAIQARVLENFLKGKATWIYADEVHVMTDNPYSARYLRTAYKTYRKFGGIVTGLTQNIADLLKDKDMATLISNSQYTMFMAQAPKDTELILESFDDVTYEQLKYVRNAEPGTGLVRFGNTFVPMDNRMEPTVPLYAIFSTNMHEKAALKQAQGK